jgi:hypothetical protein
MNFFARFLFTFRAAFFQKFLHNGFFTRLQFAERSYGIYLFIQSCARIFLFSRHDAILHRKFISVNLRSSAVMSASIK